MSTYFILFLLAKTTCIVSSLCKNTFQEPVVTVADSEHLLVNWEKSFEGCDSSEILNAKVHIGSEKRDVTFSKKEARIRANPCLTHPPIKVKVLLKEIEVEVWSHETQYNEYNVNPKLENLYSGLLQKQIVDKICLQDNANLFVPDIPDEPSECVMRYEKQRKYARSCVLCLRL